MISIKEKSFEASSSRGWPCEAEDMQQEKEPSQKPTKGKRPPHITDEILQRMRENSIKSRQHNSIVKQKAKMYKKLQMELEAQKYDELMKEKRGSEAALLRQKKNDFNDGKNNFEQMRGSHYTGQPYTPSYNSPQFRSYDYY
eukprot:766185-Hanusia_phi.AAC.1